MADQPTLAECIRDARLLPCEHQPQAEEACSPCVARAVASWFADERPESPLLEVPPLDPATVPAASEVGAAYVQGHGRGFSTGFERGMSARMLLRGGEDGFVLHETASDDRERPCTSHVGRLELAVIRDNRVQYLAYRAEGEDHWQAVADLNGDRVGFWSDAAGDALELLEVRRRG